jgi:hypothetical protein
MTWAVKWLVAGVVVGFGEVVDNVREQVTFRITGEHASVVDAFGQATTMNVEYWFDRPLGFLIPVALIAVIFLALRGWRREILQPSYLVLLFGLTMAPFVWYEALSSHSQIHHWITYKSLPLALGALLFALAVGNTDNRKRFRPQSIAAGAPELDLKPLNDPGGAPRHSTGRGSND